MKNILSVLSLILFAVTSYSQIKSGTIIYEIVTQAKDTTLGIQTDKAMFPGSKLHIDFVPNKSRIKFDLAQGFIITSTVDLESNKGLKTLQSENGNYAMSCAADEAKMSFDTDENVEVELTKEKKRILGYSCRKALIITDSVETIYWYTKDLKIDFSGQKILNSQLPGFPLSFTTQSNGVETTFIAVKVIDEIKDYSVFSTEVPEGYIITEGGM